MPRISTPTLNVFPYLQNGLYPVFLAEVLLADVVDLQTVGRSQFFCIDLDSIGQWPGKLREIEDPDPPFAQICRHPLGIAEHRQRPLHDHPVKAGQHPGDLLRMAFGQQCQAHHPPPWADDTQIALLFGSGYAGSGRGNVNFRSQVLV
jgi:hypothetical protein